MSDEVDAVHTPEWNAAYEMMMNLWPQEDWENHPHLKGTPVRFIKMLRELTTRPDINWKDFESSNTDEMVIVKDIGFTSLCAHHLVPFMGVAHVAYIPNGRICGISKLARVVRHFAAGLQVQEELTVQVADYIQGALTWESGNIYTQDKETRHPIGVAVVMEAEHLCMTIRGVQAPGAKTVTSCMKGAFADHKRLARSEFLNFIKGD